MYTGTDALEFEILYSSWWKKAGRQGEYHRIFFQSLPQNPANMYYEGRIAELTLTVQGPLDSEKCTKSSATSIFLHLEKHHNSFPESLQIYRRVFTRVWNGKWNSLANSKVIFPKRKDRELTSERKLIATRNKCSEMNKRTWPTDHDIGGS